MQGIINVYKPQNYTSHDCVAIVRRVTGVKRVGHTGTLDPMATGVLPICIGRATKVIQYMEDAIKEYRCTMKLGTVTDTLDIWGNVIRETNNFAVDQEEIIKAVCSFKGEIEQIPPKYSALKVNGKKLYEYAREGKDVEIKPRRVTIHHIKVDDIKDNYVNYTVRCSKGTYVRTLCDDIGRILGTGACMSALERTESSPFTVDKAIDIEEIKTMAPEDIAHILYPLDYPLNFEKLSFERGMALDIVNGKYLDFGQVSDGTYSVYTEDKFVGIAKVNDGVLHAEKIINTDII